MKFRLMIRLLVMKEGTTNSNVPVEEQEDEMSLYNFKLAGLISGKRLQLYFFSQFRWRSIDTYIRTIFRKN